MKRAMGYECLIACGYLVLRERALLHTQKQTQKPNAHYACKNMTCYKRWIYLAYVTMCMCAGIMHVFPKNMGRKMFEIH